MRPIALIIFVCTLGGSLQAQQSHEEMELSLATDSGSLSASYISIPGHTGRIALIIPGSGPTDRNGNSAMGLKNNSLKMVAEALAENGIPSIRIDKRGIAGSKSAAVSEEMLSFDMFVDDAKNWIDLSVDSLGYQSVVVVGHSQGALVGMLAAIDNEKVSGFVSLAGVADQVGNIIRQQISRQAPVLVNDTDTILDSLEMGLLVKNVNPLLFSLFRPSVQPFLISYMQYTPAEEIARLHIPMLIINGTTDIQVPAADAETLKKAAPDARLVIIENMNHVLKESSADLAANMATYNQPELPLAAELMPVITAFIKNLN